MENLVCGLAALRVVANVRSSQPPARPAHFVFVENPALLGRGHGICVLVGYAPFDVVYLNYFEELRLILNSKNIFCFPDTGGLEKKFNCPNLTRALSVADGNFFETMKITFKALWKY